MDWGDFFISILSSSNLFLKSVSLWITLAEIKLKLCKLSTAWSDNAVLGLLGVKILCLIESLCWLILFFMYCLVCPIYTESQSLQGIEYTILDLRLKSVLSLRLLKKILLIVLWLVKAVLILNGLRIFSILLDKMGI